MIKEDFKPFKVGTVFNKVPLTSKPIINEEENIAIKYPSRLEAMALDPSKIVANSNLIYTAGQIDLSVKIYRTVSVKRDRSHQDVTVSPRTKRQSLVRHAALITKELLEIEHGLNIDVQEELDLRHCGLGSSSALIAGVISAINEMYNLPLSKQALCRFAAQNHGEESDKNEDVLIPVQCIGGSAVCGNFDGALIILSGQSTPIFRSEINSNYSVVIAVPNDFSHPDSKELMGDEEKNMAGFKNTGDKFGKTIAYQLVHEAMPGLMSDDLKPIKKLIFNYRWNMGSIKNCSFVYPRMMEIADSLRKFENDDDAKLISLSSVGPGFFVLTDKPQKFENVFKNLGMRTVTTSVNNQAYQIVRG